MTSAGYPSDLDPTMTRMYATSGTLNPFSGCLAKNDVAGVVSSVRGRPCPWLAALLWCGRGGTRARRQVECPVAPGAPAPRPLRPARTHCTPLRCSVCWLKRLASLLPHSSGRTWTPPPASRAPPSGRTPPRGSTFGQPTMPGGPTTVPSSKNTLIGSCRTASDLPGAAAGPGRMVRPGPTHRSTLPILDA